MKKNKKIIIISAGIFLSANLWISRALAQNDSDIDEMNVIEVELEKSAPKIEPQRKVKESQPQNQEPLSDFSGLGKLAPFSEVSVIQKRYLPKTERFQLYGGLGLITNDPFFNTLAANLKLSYFFTESWGLEGTYMAMTTSEAKSTQELKNIQGVTTDNLVYPKSYLGLDVVWVPIYGKMSWFNKKIINFDTYFALGGGSTKIQDGTSPGTVHFGVGQIFALSKAFSIRWDFSWNFYQATSIDQSGSATSEKSKSLSNNLFLTMGASFFFPEAKYR